MEIDITRFFQDCDPWNYSASCAEIGQNAGRITWQAALADAPEFADMLGDDDKREAFRDHVRGFGAWSADEIAAWSDDELTALFIQLVAGDIREAGLDTHAPDWAEFEALSEAGQVSGNLFPGTDGKIYYYLGN